MRKLLIALCAFGLAFVSGCGGEEDPQPPPVSAPPPAGRAPTEPAPPSARKPEAGAGPARRLEGEKEASGGGIGPVGQPYLCRGEQVRRLSSEGPVQVSPAVVRPGERFTVTITDPEAGEAAVGLAGASTEPVFEQAERSGGRLRARLRVPRGASCGNKLLTVEGDLTAEAYVAVRP